MTRRRAALAGVLALALVLAFPLRQAVHQAIVIPAAYVFWALGLFYRSLSQDLWWIALVLLVIFILGRSLMPQLQPSAQVLPRPKEARGQVQELARWLSRSKNGTYFKWLVANRLGKLAYQILLQRDNGKPRSVFQPLTGPDWHPSADLQTYLQAGLHRSFADFPHSRRFFASPAKSPLDLKVEEAVDFLERQMDH